MSLFVKLGKLPERPSSVTVQARVGSLPSARIVWRIEAGNEVPSARALVGETIEVGLSRSAGAAEAPSFYGEVCRVRTLRLGSRRHELEVEATTIPAAIALNLGRRASWRTFEAGAELKAVMIALLEDAGFAGLTPDPAPEGATPAQIVAGGVSAWALLEHLAWVHGYAVVVNPRVSADSPKKVGFVNTGSALATLGKKVDVSFTGSPTQNVLLSIESVHSVAETTAVGPWMKVDDESKWSEVGGSTKVLVTGGLAVSEGVAKARADGCARDLESAEVGLEARIEEPFLALGDALSLDDKSDCGGDLAGLLGDPPIVYGLEWIDTEDSGGSGFEGLAWLSPPSKPVPRAYPDPLVADPVQLLTGKVLSMPDKQSQMEVQLDVPDAANGGKPAKVLVEWVPHWLSGDNGGLHFPPLPEDHVVLLAESRPYGRVLYLGAHPSQTRLDTVRKQFTTKIQIEAPKDRSAAIGDPLSLKGDHLTRALVVGSNNVTAWTAPKAGLGDGGSDSSSAVWHRLSASVGEALMGFVPGRFLAEVKGGEALAGIRSERLLGVESEENTTLMGKELVQVSSKAVDSKSSEKTLIVAEKDLEQKGQNVSVEAQQKSSLKCSDLEQSAQSSAKLDATNVEVAGKSAVKVKGAQLELTAQASGKLSGATLDIKGSGPTNVQGTPLSLN